MNFRIILFTALTLSFFLASCTPEHSKIVLAEYGDYNIKMKEFEDAYAKNTGVIEQAKKDSVSKYKNFLDLYVNFKMKLRDAEVRGYNDDPELNQELLDYKKKVGSTYILEKKIIEPGIKELYERRKYELRISHIMIRPDSSGEENARAMAESILDSIRHGASFEEMAKTYSQDFYSKNYGGDIFYATAGILPPEFEDEAYKATPGVVYPKVVKSKFGYHVLMVTDKRPRTPQIRASHILINFNDDHGVIDTFKALGTMDTIIQKLKDGESFAELAKKYSEDPGTKNMGGDLNYFERRMMVREFDEAAFNLEVGQVSAIVRTNFGYHLIKLTDKKPLPSFEEDRENLKKIFKQTRYQEAYDNLIGGLRKKFNYSLNNQTLELASNNKDSVRFGANYESSDLRNQIKDKTLFSFAGKNILFDEFASAAQADQEFSNRLMDKAALDKAAEKISANFLLDHEALQYEKENPEFASLMEDYKNGIYIFKLQDEEVWSKINLDSTKLYEFYLKTKDDYQYPDRVEFSEIFSRSDSLINRYMELLKNGADFDSLAAAVTERPGFKEKAGHFELMESNYNQLAFEANKLQLAGDYSEPVANSGGYSIIKLIKKEPARVKTYEESRAEAAGAFQEAESKRLENEYIGRLKKLYKPEIFYDNLEKAYKSN